MRAVYSVRVHAHETYYPPSEMHACNIMHADEEMPTPLRWTLVRCTSKRYNVYKMYAINLNGCIPYRWVIFFERALCTKIEPLYLPCKPNVALIAEAR